MLVRYPHGVTGEFFYQKRAPTSRPDWIEVVTLHFPSGRSADEVVPRHAAALAWLANLACLELHPHPVRAEDLDHPDELRVDLDPVPGVQWPQVRAVAHVVAEDLLHLEAEDVAPESERPLDVGDLQVHMADVDSRVDGARACRGPGVRLDRHRDRA